MKTNPNINIYDKLAKVYDRHYRLAIHQIENDYIFRRIKNGEYNKGMVLDIGCGTGEALSYIGAYSGRMDYTGIDISLDMLKEAMIKFPNHKFFLQDMNKMHFADNSFDNVLALFGSLSYSVNLEEAISEIRRVLKPGGRFFIMFYGESYPKRKNYILNEYGIVTPFKYKNQKALFSSFSEVKFSVMTLFSDKLSKYLSYSLTKLIHYLEIVIFGRFFPQKFYYQIYEGKNADKI